MLIALILLSFLVEGIRSGRIPTLKEKHSLVLRRKLQHPRARCLRRDFRRRCPIARLETPTRYLINPSGSRFTEVSYMAHSEQKNGANGNPVMWVGGDGPWDSLSAVDLVTGNKIRTYYLKGVDKSGDWESISLGPCTKQKRDLRRCIYVADTGNNGAHGCKDQDCSNGRSRVKVIKFEEPNLVEDDDDDEIEVVILNLNYHNKGFPTDRADCEAVFVDYKGDKRGGKRGDLYLVTKFPSDRELQRIAKVPVEFHQAFEFGEESDEYSVLPVGNPISERLWTGGDMRLNGDLIALRDYSRVHFFPRPKFLSVGEALSLHPCDFKSQTRKGGDEHQFEAVAWMGDDISEASECAGKKECKVAVTLYKLIYPEEDLNVVIPEAGVLYEAEDFSSQSDTALEATHAPFSGDAYMNFGGEGSYLELDVNVRRSGRYRLLLRYAASDTNGRPCKVYVTGKGFQVFDAPFRNTFAWTNWQFEVLEDVVFCRGVNRIRVQSIDRGPNLDYVGIENVEEPSDLLEAERPASNKDTSIGLSGLSYSHKAENQLDGGNLKKGSSRGSSISSKGNE